MLKLAAYIIAALLAFAGAALAGECRDARALPTGEVFCADAANIKRHPICKTDPILCPGPMLDPCFAPGANPNGAACSAAKVDAAAHKAIMAQCYSAAGRRTDADAKSKCSQIWR